PYSSYYLRLVTVRGQSAFYPLSLHDALPISLPARRQEVQTRIRRVVPPPAGVRTIWMLGIQRRLVRRCEWDTLLPKPGCLPQTSHTRDTGCSCRVGGRCLRSKAPVNTGNQNRLPHRPAATPTGHPLLRPATAAGHARRGTPERVRRCARSR